MEERISLMIVPGLGNCKFEGEKMFSMRQIMIKNAGSIANPNQ
jgi:hypothetical protein